MSYHETSKLHGRSIVFVIGETYLVEALKVRTRAPKARSCAGGGGGGGRGACSPENFLKNWCNFVSFGSFSESKFLVQKALFFNRKNTKV